MPHPCSDHFSIREFLELQRPKHPASSQPIQPNAICLIHAVTIHHLNFPRTTPNFCPFESRLDPPHRKRDIRHHGAGPNQRSQGQHARKQDSSTLAHQRIGLTARWTRGSEQWGFHRAGGCKRGTILFPGAQELTAEAELAAGLLELALIVFAGWGCRAFIIKFHLANSSTGYVGMWCCG